MTNSLVTTICEAVESCLDGATHQRGLIGQYLLPCEGDGQQEWVACQFFQELRDSGCELSDDNVIEIRTAIEVIESKIEQITDDDVDTTKEICETFKFAHPDLDARRFLARQVLHRLAGYLYAWLTASGLPKQERLSSASEDDAWVDDLDQCGFHLNETWKYPFEPTLNQSKNGLTQQGRVDQALAHAIDRGWVDRQGNNAFVHPLTRLTVRRMLRYILSEEDVIGIDQNAVQTVDMLTVTRRMNQVDDDQAGGRVRPVSLHADNEATTGWYFDPVTWGIVVFDKDMQLAVELAGRLSYEKLRDSHDGKAIRLMPIASPARVPAIHGNSAGGLVACAIYAFSRGEQLTNGITASVGLKLRKGLQIKPSTTITEKDIVLTGVGGVPFKLAAAAEAGMQAVALHKANNDEADQHKIADLPRHCQTKAIDSFPGLHGYLTNGYRIEQVVRQYAALVSNYWDRMTKGEVVDGGDDHRLDVYVEPRLSLRIDEVNAADGDPQGQNLTHRATDKWEELPQGVEPLVDRWLEGDRWLIITEDAGGGKTVLSWKLQDVLSRQDEPFFCIRFETNWPVDLRKSLVERLETIGVGLKGVEAPIDLKPSDLEVCDIVNWLLENRRVVVIFDALDQVNDDTSTYLRKLINNPDDNLLSKDHLRVIVTSRPYRVQLENVFDANQWQHTRLELFNEAQQDDYRDQFNTIRGGNTLTFWKEITEPDGDRQTELMVYPVVLRQIRYIIENSDPNGKRRFRTAGDLFWEVTYLMLERAFKGDNPFQHFNDDIEKLIETVACFGIEIMLQCRAASVPTGQIASVREAARARFAGDDKTWDLCNEILNKTHLTDRTVMRANDAGRELSFPSQKMLEFSAALYMARYATDGIVGDLIDVLGDPDWGNVWSFTVEMPISTDRSSICLANPAAIGHSLRLLFSCPTNYPRPTTEMFRAWQVMAHPDYIFPEKRGGLLEQTLDHYRRSFRASLIDGVLTGEPSERAKLAAQVVLADDIHPLVEQAKKEQVDQAANRIRRLPPRTEFPSSDEEEAREKLENLYRQADQIDAKEWAGQLTPSEPAFGFCCDENDQARLTFMMGASPEDQDAYDDEKYDPSDRQNWWREITLDSFYMGTCCITRAQFAVFDAIREKQNLTRDDGKENGSPDPDCPITHVNFYDSFCFALWLGDGYELPSECQWEGAAWGGINRREHPDYVIGIPPYHRGFSAQDVNYKGDMPMDEQVPAEDRLDRGRTVAVRFAEFKPNGFGLWQMHGNVYEWCRTGWHDTLREACDSGRLEMVVNIGRGVPRCVRGGFWNSRARNCRASYRIYNVAYIRYDSIGFRVTRTK